MTNHEEALPGCTCRRPRASKYIQIDGVTHDLCVPIARFIDNAAHYRELLQRIHNDPSVGSLHTHIQDALGRAMRNPDHV